MAAEILTGKAQTRRSLKKCFFVFLAISVCISAAFYFTDFLSTIQILKRGWQSVTFIRDVYTTTPVPNTTIKLTTPEDARKYHHVYPRQYHFDLNEPDVCQSKKPFLVLMVPVHPSEMDARVAIRATWGNETVVQGKVVTTLFLLGKVDKDTILQEKINSESAIHQDILQSNFADTYLNLTIKTMLIMDWLATYCPSAAYAMKIDSDLFLNVENLVSMLLLPQTPKQNYITGNILWGPPVIRDPNVKWYVPKDVYPDTHYPIYLQGLGYVFSNDLPEKLVQISKNVKPFHFEDVYLGLCLKVLKIKPTSAANPSQFKAFVKGPFNRCDYVWTITMILDDPLKLLTYWKAYKKGGPC